LVLAFDRAEGFLPMLSGQLNIGSYEGIVRRKEGVHPEAAITGADPEIFVVDLGVGTLIGSPSSNSLQIGS